MKLTFLGAARQVTGSMYLLQLEENYKILIDCGTDFSKNLTGDRFFPFNAGELDLVLLTHAHLDHSGNIPFLFMEGYKGQILCTPPTQDLTDIILKDAATLHSHQLKKRIGRKKNVTRNFPELRHAYLEKQVNDAVDRFLTIAFNKRFEVKPGLAVTFIPTGHLLGAANILIETEENGRMKSCSSPEISEEKNILCCPTPHQSRKWITSFVRPPMESENTMTKVILRIFFRPLSKKPVWISRAGLSFQASASEEHSRCCIRFINFPCRKDFLPLRYLPIARWRSRVRKCMSCIFPC